MKAPATVPTAAPIHTGAQDGAVAGPELPDGLNQPPVSEASWSVVLKQDGTTQPSLETRSSLLKPTSSATCVAYRSDFRE